MKYHGTKIKLKNKMIINDKNKNSKHSEVLIKC